MAVVIHPDGYYQITEWHDIVNVSPGSIMWKLYRGIQERQGYDFERYSGTTFTVVDDIEDAIIEPEANLQATAFWRRLQIKLTNIGNLPWLNPITVGPDDAVPVPTASPFATLSFLDRIATFRARQSLDDTGGRLLVEDDIIGAWLVNDILRALWECQWIVAAETNIPRFLRDKDGNIGPTDAGPTIIRLRVRIQNDDILDNDGLWSDAAVTETRIAGSEFVPYPDITARYIKTLAVGPAPGGLPFVSMNGREAGLWYLGETTGTSITVTASDLEYSYSGADPIGILGYQDASSELYIATYARVFFADIPP